MDKRKKINLKKIAVNLFGAIGYFFCSLQWFWATALYLSVIQNFVVFISPEPSKKVNISSPAVYLNPNPLTTALSVIILIIVVMFTLYITLKLPSTLAKTSKNIVHETAEKIAPITLKLQHKKDTKKMRLQLTPRIILIMKILLILVPILLAFMSQFIQKQSIDFFIAMYVSLGLACLSLIFFAIQYSLARFLPVKYQELW